jgi:glutamine synthetase
MRRQDVADYDVVKKTIAEKGAEFIDLRIVDLIGRWRHITLPVNRFTPELVEQGVAFDGSNYGYMGVSDSDMVVRPDLDTAVIVTYENVTLLSMLGEIHHAGGKGPFLGDPRGIAKRAVHHLVAEGIAEEILLGPEYEFYVFAEVQYGTASEESYYEIFPLNERGEYSFYQICPPDDQLFALRNEICRRLKERGISVKYHHHEVGTLGQVEIELGFGGLVATADATLAVKQIVREAAYEAGFTATFMPKPLFAEAGNGMHVHQFLSREGHSLFERDGGLSEMALCYIGGLLKHGPSLMALTNPSTNSYRRLVPGYEAPVSFTFGEGNRSTTIRIPEYANPQERRIELRTLDATCNPYLAYAAMLMAGIDGIVNDWNAARLGYGPYSEDLGSSSEEVRKTLDQIPADLAGALGALEADHDYLLTGDVFPESFLSRWVEVKREEIKQVRGRPHPHEFELYYTL